MTSREFPLIIFFNSKNENTAYIANNEFEFNLIFSNELCERYSKGFYRKPRPVKDFCDADKYPRESAILELEYDRKMKLWEDFSVITPKGL